MSASNRAAQDFPDAIWVRHDDALGLDVSQVRDPEGLAAIEPGWQKYIRAESVPLSPSVVAMLAEFHEHPNALHEGTNTQALRTTLHEEEHEELMTELEYAVTDEANLGQIARELADVVYVSYGTAWAFGIDLDVALAEIHRCAMVKMDAGIRRADGKIMKPPGFVPPDMTDAIREAHS